MGGPFNVLIAGGGCTGATLVGFFGIRLCRKNGKAQTCIPLSSRPIYTPPFHGPDTRKYGQVVRGHVRQRADCGTLRRSGGDETTEAATSARDETTEARLAACRSFMMGFTQAVVLGVTNFAFAPDG